MIEWQLPEFQYHKKSDWWPVWVVFLAFLLGLLALWQKNFLFLIFIIIAAFAVLSIANEKPKNIDFALDDKGLHLGAKFYELKSFSAFALKDGRLQFKNKGRLRPFLTVPYPEDRQEEIKKHLLAFLPEIEYNESLVEVLTNILRF